MRLRAIRTCMMLRLEANTSSMFGIAGLVGRALGQAHAQVVLQLADPIADATPAALRVQASARR